MNFTALLVASLSNQLAAVSLWLALLLRAFVVLVAFVRTPIQRLPDLRGPFS